MSKVNPVPIDIIDFVQNQFQANPKNTIFWDTCSLLDILRFPYREGNVDSFKKIIEILNLINNNELYSLCSSLTIVEWNEHEESIRIETDKSLELTSTFNENSIDIINHIFSTTYPKTKINDKGLVVELENICNGILSKTVFLNTNSISDNALWRVAQKKPPASKKQEFKDCAIWETVLSVSTQVQSHGKKVVFFTVNTDDYIDKSRNPKIPYANIISEAVSHGVQFTLNFEDTLSNVI